MLGFFECQYISRFITWFSYSTTTPLQRQTTLSTRRTLTAKCVCKVGHGVAPPQLRRPARYVC